ncbi:cuticle protein CP14.6-like [Toxorhynchites rutilus septentrionalis]|uniref:cuticle protein CP14.6-like n=1 Tax=Toxorhynchites rutilus septentrionalis TaxID=329112 RepID=UPI00247A7C25|nr:cuticle protein CP14.6-like [Toxorhynchites rutilus septentrionalis]
MNPILKILAIVVVISGAAVSAPVNKDDTQLTVVNESNNHSTNDFSWSYELSDGREVRQNAYVKKLDDGTEVLVITGAYKYIGPDGVKYTVNYFADEDGYHPTVTVGDEMPVPRPVGIDPKVLASLVG